ncbi:MAG: response regulator [Myxococcales bacterium]|nr:response regulator [Myxococcales bacterium]
MPVRSVVLLIDDSPTVSLVLRRLLEPRYQVRDLDSFFDLSRAIGENPPDLILLDLEMPAMSGRAVGHFLRRTHGDRFPVLIYSSRPEPELREAAEEIAAAGWVSKTLPPEQLVSRIELELERHPAVITPGGDHAGR